MFGKCPIPRRDIGYFVIRNGLYLILEKWKKNTRYRHLVDNGYFVRYLPGFGHEYVG